MGVRGQDKGKPKTGKAKKDIRGDKRENDRETDSKEQGHI